MRDLQDDGIVIQMPFVYIAHCADDTLYVGHTDNLALREKAHNGGHGARHTAVRRPIRIVYSEQCEDNEAAIARERQLKGWTVAKKKALIAGNLARLRMLSKRCHET